MTTPDAKAPAPALQEMFDAARFRSVAWELKTIDAAFDAKKFLKPSLSGLDDLSLMQPPAPDDRMPARHAPRRLS